MSDKTDLFARAALVARDMERFEMVASLRDDEREALAYERDHKWHGSKMMWYTVGLCAVGAATQGWDQTGANGANLSFPQEFGIAGHGRDEWLVGLINSIIFLTAGLMCVEHKLPNWNRGERGLLELTGIFVVVLSLSILSTTISAAAERSSSPVSALRPRLSPRASRPTGRVCSSRASSWALASAPRTPPSPSSRPRSPPTASVVRSSCSGSCGS